MSSPLRMTGTSFGHTHAPVRVTFADGGPLGDQPSVLRTAYGHVLPTTLGFLAGAMSLVRHPEILAALSVALGNRQDKTLFQHLLKVFEAHIAAIYADKSSLEALKLHLAEQHNRTVPAGVLPTWYLESISDQPIALSASVEWAFKAISAAIARAHSAVGLVPASDGGAAYCDELFRTAGVVNGLRLGGHQYDVNGLTEAATYPGLLSEFLLRRAGVIPEMLSSILAEQVGDQTVGQLADLFVGLMPPTDRYNLGLEWGDADQLRFEGWARGHRELIRRWDMSKIEMIEIGQSDLAHGDFFNVATQRWRISLPSD